MQIKEITAGPRDRVRQKLETLPDDEVYSTSEISEKFNVQCSTLRHMTSELKDNVYKLGTTTKWGSKKAIKALAVHMNGGTIES